MIISFLKALNEFFKYNYKVYKGVRKKDILRINSRFRNSESGEVYILLTGSSLSGKDLGFLKNKKVIATNMFFMSDFYREINVSHYLLVEPWQYRKQWLLSWMLEMIMLRKNDESQTNIWLNITSYPYINDQLLHFDRETANSLKKNKFNYVSAKGDFLDGEIKNDFHETVNTTSGSIYASIFLAIYLGYETIYLLGADYTKLPFFVGHFYDNTRNHWTEEKMDELNQLDPLSLKMKNKLEQMRNYAETKNVDIINIIDGNETSPYLNHIKYQNINTIDK